MVKKAQVKPEGYVEAKEIVLDKRIHFSIWYFIVAMLFLLLLQSWLTQSHNVPINYSDFKKILATKQVSDLVIGKGKIRGSITTQGLKQVLPADKVAELTKSGEKHTFTTIRVDDPDLTKELQTDQISYTGELESTLLNSILGFVLPLVFLVLIWQFMFRRMGQGGGMMSIGKSKAKVFAESDVKTNFSNVAGIDEAVEELYEVVAFLKTPDKFTRLGGRLPKGILLVGPPGTGKTLLARAVAGEAGVPFLSLSGSEFVEMFVGVGAARVRDLFEKAQSMAPCIIFIDELDALGRARGIGSMGSNEEREQTLNQLLTEMDGFNPNKGVILMAATNRPEILDPALLRAGRFDRHVVVDRPDIKGREAILRIHTAHLILNTNVNLAILAARTPGFVGADLANIANEAALLAAREGRSSVEMADFDEAIERVVAGLRKKSRIMTPEEKHRVAIHETGHAMVACLVEHADPIHKVSIIPRGITALGYTTQIPAQERRLYTRVEIMDRLAVMLGGRVAEELILKDISTGAADDLQKATELVRSCLVEYGMSQTLGPVAFNLERANYLPTFYPQTQTNYSSETENQIDRETRDLLEEVQARVKKLLSEHQQILIRVATLLEQKEIIEGSELRQLLAENQPQSIAKE